MSPKAAQAMLCEKRPQVSPNVWKRQVVFQFLDKLAILKEKQQQQQLENEKEEKEEEEEEEEKLEQEKDTQQ